MDTDQTLRQMPEAPPGVSEESRSSIWSHVKFLTRNTPGLMALLILGSLLAALSEGAILGILAQTALLLVDHSSHAHLSIGSIRLRPSLGSLLVLGASLAVLRLLLQGVIAFVPAVIQGRTQQRLRSGVFSAFTLASWDQQATDTEGHLQELVTNHAQQASATYVYAAQLIVSLVTFAVLVVAALALFPLAALAVVVVAGALLLALRPFGTLGAGYAATLSRAWLGFATGVTEAVRLAEEIHVFGAEASQRSRVDRLISGMRRPIVLAQWLTGFVPGAYQCLIYLMLVVGLFGMYETGAAHVATLGAVILLLVRSGAYGQQTQSAIQAIRQTQPYLERLRDAERRYRESVRPDGAHRLEEVREVTFSDVSFAYDRREDVLSGVNFRVAGGEAIGIIGPSGAGKSTLVQILLGLRSPNSGEYLVNGVPAAAFRQDDWRHLFAYVPQEPKLLHASVAENIRFFRDLSDEAVERAGELAGIHQDVLSWPRQYATLVGPRADAISGGQQQRICLARALAADPEVLVLDEPTSALDPGAEQLIQESLLALKHKLTLFIVAHRMSTLNICERVMVILDGRLNAFDTIDELSKTNAYYRSAMSSGNRPPRLLPATAGSEQAQ